MKTSICFFLATIILAAQTPPPQQTMPVPANTGQSTPIFRITVVSRTTKAINYHHRTGTTHIDFRGTELMPSARGEASVSSQNAGVRFASLTVHNSRVR